MRTLESTIEIEVGMEVKFAELWDGNGDGNELLESGSICIGDDDNDMPVIVAFEIIEESTDILNTLVKINDIY